MFKTILHANDGSDNAFKALAFALDLAKQSGTGLHMVSVEELPYMPESAEEVREEKGTAARRFRSVIKRAKAMADAREIKLDSHVVAGHPVRDIHRACARTQGRPARHRRHWTLGLLRAHDRQPRRPADSIGSMSGSGH